VRVSALSSVVVPARRDRVLVVLAGLLWGTGGLSGVLLAHATGLNPSAVATYRLAGGGLSLLVALGMTGRLARRHTGAQLRRVLAIGVLAALYQACYFGAVALTGVAVATLVTLGVAPVLVLGAETALSRRRPASAQLGAAGLAVLGLMLLVGTPGAVRGSALAVGAGLAVLAAAGFGVITLLGRFPVPGLDAATGVGAGFTVGALLLAVVSLAAGGGAALAFHPGPAALGLLAYLGAVPTALAYACYFAGLRGVSAASAAVVAVLEPVTATLLGVVVLGDRLGRAEVAGAVLLCAAAVLAAARSEPVDAGELRLQRVGACGDQAERGVEPAQ
jgi:DME family drug/metabolite transporter